MHILWLKTELLHPVDKGGKIRTFNMLKELKRYHQITYLSLDDGSAGLANHERATEYCHELISIPHSSREKFTAGFYFELICNLISKKPYAIKKYESASMRQKIFEQIRDRSVDVLVCDFLAPAVNVPQSLPCLSVLFQHNIEAMIWKRHHEMQSNLIKKAFLFWQWRKMRRLERNTCRRFDCVIAVSAKDRQQMQQEYSLESVFDVPTGVDTDFFRPRGLQQCDPHNLVFTGSMDWLPNEDAMRYFTEQIMPRIREAVPDVSLTVVGRNPYSGLIDLSRREPSITVTGRVEDVRPYIERAAAYVVPLRIGGGTRLKIFEAMAMEKAIVSTSIGAEGLPVKHGEELLLADTPGAFADSIVRLFSDQAYARKLGQCASRAVRDQFGWPKVAQRFSEICECVIRDSRVRRVEPAMTVNSGARSAV